MTTPTTLPPVPSPSPCTRICRMDARTGLCEGCLRTIDEIVGWSAMPDDEKRVIWQALGQRRLDALMSKAEWP